MNTRLASTILICAAALGSFLPMGGCPLPLPPPPRTSSFAGIDFVWCVPGSFMMGASTDDPDGANDEFPQHQVTFAQGFWISKYPVTQGQWKKVMGTNPSTFQGGGLGNTDNRPVEHVTWDDAQSFIAALNAANPNLGFRLPSEAEWEYACRAGTTSRFYWGDDPGNVQVSNYAWYEDNSGNHTHDVGTRLPNLWSIFDMSGHVYEWVQDSWSDYSVTPTDGSAYDEPDGPDTARMMRGGSFANQPFRCRSSARAVWLQNSTGDNLGFRLAKF